MADDHGMMWSIERQGGVAGLVSVAIGLLAEVFERGIARGGTDAATIRHFQEQAGAVRMQTLLFVLGAAFLFWFLAGLRSRLAAAEGGDGSLALLVLVAGAASNTVSLIALSVQEALTLETPSTALAALDDALFLIAGLPLAVVLVAVAVLAFTRHAFASWIGWLSIAAAVLQIVPLFGMLASGGPLAPGGWVSAFLPYPLYLIWLTAVAVLMTMRPISESERVRRDVPASIVR
ncbi:hypothetical protein [Leifsonia sp. NPDC058248]|uniref:hypothetical protein n=1 Tax=Leifsonia sp. NPDC058248 TaxID=3346402 RepID=UPI0036DBCB43